MSSNSDDRSPAFYDGQDRATAPRRGNEDRLPSFYDGQDRGGERKRGAEDRLPAFYAGQDWTEVTIRGKAKAAASASGPIPKYTSQASHLRKLEQADGPIKLKHLSSESKQMIVAKRVANGWNQTQLNQQCGFPLHTIRDIENSKLTPTPGQLNVLNRVLKTGLKYE
jgi:hypothetical protein